MKKTALLIALTTIGFVGCDKLKDLTQFTVPVGYTQEVNIGTGLPDTLKTLPNGGISIDLPKIGIATNSSQTMSQNNTAKDKIISFKLGSFTMTMTQPANANFDYVDSVKLYLSTTAQTEVLAAHKYGISKGQTTFQLDCDTSVDYKNYFFGDSMYVRMGIHLTSIPDSNAKLELKPTFNLTANPLN